MSVAMKCFERLVMAHINTIIPETLDPLQFAYRTNRSTDDAISIALHIALSHLDKRNTDVRMLFIDYSSAFNTIVPSELITKLRTLGQNTSATLILNPLYIVSTLTRYWYPLYIASTLTLYWYPLYIASTLTWYLSLIHI